MTNSKQALIIIDVQNDYFPGGSVPLWNANGALHSILAAVEKARAKGIPVILVQHLIDPQSGGDLFHENTYGAEIHPALLTAVPDAPVVVKRYTDSFKETSLKQVLTELGVTELLFCGMQTQNCVGLTAISQQASAYRVSILADCCTAEAQHVHLFALGGFGDIVPVVPSSSVLA